MYRPEKMMKLDRSAKEGSVSFEEMDLDSSLDNSTNSEIWDNLSEQLRY